MALNLIIAAGVVAVLYGFITRAGLMKASTGNERMNEIARWHDAESGGTDYQQVVARAWQQVDDPALTLSAQILDEMSSKQQSFWQLALRYSRKWHQQHLDLPMSDTIWETMTQDAASSLQRQTEIESHESESFDAYLSQFYRQYQSI